MKPVLKYLFLFFFAVKLSAERIVISDFSKMNLSAKEEALGYSNAAELSNPASLNINPASPGLSSGNYFGFSHSDRFGLGIIEDSIVYSGQFKSDLNVFAFYQNQTVGDIPVTDVERYKTNLEPTGTGAVLNTDGLPYVFGCFSENRRAYGFGLQSGILRSLYSGFLIKRIEHNFSGTGLEDKYLNSLIHQEASGFSLDMGFIYRLRKYLSFGLSFRNLYQTGLVWNTEYDYEEALPFEINSGITYEQLIKHFLLRVNFNFNYAEKYSRGINLGVDLNMYEALSLRGGYSNGQLTAGMGMKINIKNVPFIIDYAYIPLSDMNTHKLSIGFYH